MKTNSDCTENRFLKLFLMLNQVQEVVMMPVSRSEESKRQSLQTTVEHMLSQNVIKIIVRPKSLFGLTIIKNSFKNVHISMASDFSLKGFDFKSFRFDWKNI